MGIFDKVNPLSKLDKRTDEEKAQAAQARVEKQEHKAEVRQEKINNLVIEARLLEGAGSLPENSIVALTNEANGLNIRDIRSNMIVVVPYGKITFAKDYSTTEITKEISEKNKSVIGRGIVGGVLFGSIGAIIGGMSGTGTKKKVKKTKETNHYFLVNYRPGQDPSSVAIAFELKKRGHIDKFGQELVNRAYSAGGFQTVTTL